MNVGRINHLSTTSATPRTQNLPYDQFGGVDWKAMDVVKLRSYSTEALRDELKRRKEQETA